MIDLYRVRAIIIRFLVTSSLLAVGVVICGNLARATQIAVTGNAAKGFASSDDYSFSGPDLTLDAGAIDGPSIVVPSSQGCGFGCGLTVDSPESPVAPGYSGGSVDGAAADFLVGKITFAFAPGFPTVLVPLAGSDSGPITFSGEVAGFDLIPVGSTGYELGPEAFDVVLSGTGTLTEEDCRAAPCVPTSPDSAFVGFRYTLTGAAMPTPEPDTLNLVGGGVFILGILLLRRTAARSALS